jgi:hypothetical protein
MEPASTEDLERASAQGTILAVKVDGRIYGKGGIDWHDDDDDPKTVALILVLLAVLCMIFLSMRKCKCSTFHTSMAKLVDRVKSRRFHHNLRKAFFEEEDDEENEYQLKSELDQKQKVIEQQQQAMEQMQLEMDQEHSIRAMEWQSSRRSIRDQFIDEPSDDECEPMEDKFVDEPTDDEAGNTDSSSDSEGGTVGSSSVSNC